VNYPAWLWIPIVFAAAAAQTVRNAAQKNLTKTAGTLAATSVRFIYGLPFAILALLVCAALTQDLMPRPSAAFFAWTTFGAVGQLAATALLLAGMQQRSFIVAVAYSKTEVLQVALFSALLLGEFVKPSSILAIAIASSGVLLLSIKRGVSGQGLMGGWLSPSALLGLASGAGFAISAVGYRGGALTLGSIAPWYAGAYTLVWAQAIQSVLIGGYLAWRQPEAIKKIIQEWRTSLTAGCAGALASFGWFTAFAMHNAADVRTLALVEVLYGYIVSWKIFKEKVTLQETLGILLLIAGIIVVSVRL
jgi:drug/metabolite transporter (DMT)-like permease